MGLTYNSINGTEFRFPYCRNLYVTWINQL